MSRDYKLFLQDILDAIHKIQIYTKDLNFETFSKSNLTIDAVVRNFEIIGEAAKNIPDYIRDKLSSIEWKKISGLRDILIHAYFGISVKIVWDLIINKISELQKQISDFLMVT